MPSNSTGRGDFHAINNGLSVDDLVMEYMEKNNIPGMTLAIVQAPYITRVVGYGLADLEKKRLMSCPTVFPLGQMTNAYTAVAVMQLKEEGKLCLDEGIDVYLPNCPKHWQGITVRQLLMHASGIPDFNQLTQPEDIFQTMKDAKLLFKSGENVQPSSSNFYLLGLIIESVSGMTYQEYVTKNQLERLGLKRTFFTSNLNTMVN